MTDVTTGTLYAFTTIHVRRPGLPGPYTVGYVDLDDGRRVLGHLDDPGSAAIGLKVRVAGGRIGETGDGEIVGHRIVALPQPHDE